jgi:hypothetical protein
MERVCGEIQRAIKARRFIYASIDKAILQQAQIDMVKLRYHRMKEELSFGRPVEETGNELGDCMYIQYIVSPPKLTLLGIDKKKKRLLLGAKTTPAVTDHLLIARLARPFATKFKVTTSIMENILEQVVFTEWKGIRTMDGGDRIRAAKAMGAAEDSRDACWVQVRDSYRLKRHDLLTHFQYAGYSKISIWGWTRGRERTFPTAFGRLDRVLSFTLPPLDVLNITVPQVFAYAAITGLQLDDEPDRGLGLYYYTKELPTQIFVDVSSVNCLIGRFRVNEKQWAILDRSGTVPRELYIDSDSWIHSCSKY